VVSSNCDLDFALAIEEALQLEHSLAGQDDLLHLARSATERHFAPGKPVAIGGYRA